MIDVSGPNPAATAVSPFAFGTTSQVLAMPVYHISDWPSRRTLSRASDPDLSLRFRRHRDALLSTAFVRRGEYVPNLLRPGLDAAHPVALRALPALLAP